MSAPARLPALLFPYASPLLGHWRPSQSHPPSLFRSPPHPHKEDLLGPVHSELGSICSLQGLWRAMSFWRVGGCYTQKAPSQLVPGGIQCLSVPRLPLLSVGTRTLLCHHHTGLTDHCKCQKRRPPHPEKLTASATLPTITWNSHYPCVNTWLRSLNTKAN